MSRHLIRNYKSGELVGARLKELPPDAQDVLGTDWNDSGSVNIHPLKREKGEACPRVSFEDLVLVFIDEASPEDKLESLKHIASLIPHHPTMEGFVLMRCNVFDSRSFGRGWLVAFGPDNRFQEPPDYPVPMNDLASSTSTAEIYCNITNNENAIKLCQTLIERLEL